MQCLTREDPQEMITVIKMPQQKAGSPQPTSCYACELCGFYFFKIVRLFLHFLKSRLKKFFCIYCIFRSKSRAHISKIPTFHAARPKGLWVLIFLKYSHISRFFKNFDQRTQTVFHKRNSIYTHILLKHITKQTCKYDPKKKEERERGKELGGVKRKSDLLAFWYFPFQR